MHRSIDLLAYVTERISISNFLYHNYIDLFEATGVKEMAETVANSLKSIDIEEEEEAHNL